MRVLLALMLLGGTAAAERDTYDALQKAVPNGWTVLQTEHELVIRHDRPCYAKDPGNPCVGADGPLVTFELRFHTEPRWTAQQLSDAKIANDKIAIELKAARDKYRVDAIHKPHPIGADEKKRESAYEKDEAALKARTVKTPLCTFGEYSLFDGDETYAPLKLKVDPPEASIEAHKIIDVLKKQCGAL